MVKHMRVKGYTMLEMLITLAIISSSLVLIRPVFITHEPLQHQIFYVDALYTQSLAMVSSTQLELSTSSVCDYSPVFYYSSGSVNQAQTISCGAHEIIIHLGSGNMT